jgi:hypothetical protein
MNIVLKIALLGGIVTFMFGAWARSKWLRKTNSKHQDSIWYAFYMLGEWGFRTSLALLLLGVCVWIVES